jgi:putative secretion ATPase (PEP-CTERM system associated)
MYESFYGLRGKPFQLNPDPSFFYASRGHKRALAYLEYGLHQNEGFIVITGEVGAGKTTLVKSLLQKLDSEKVVAAQLSSTNLDAEDMLRMISAAFGIPSKPMDKAEILLGLEMFLVSLTAVGKRALLVVDEAQNLTQRAVEELRMLSNFQLGEHALLQSFLVGQPELRETMQSPEMRQLRQRVIASYHLGPMDPEETRGYIEHRLGLVGWKNNPKIDASAFQAIFETTDGIPRRINTFCDRLLLSGFLNGKLALTMQDVREVAEELKQEAPAEPPMRHDAVTQTVGGTVIKLPMLPEVDVAKIDERFVERSRALSAGFDVGRVEERLVRLEKTVAEILVLLRRIGDDAVKAGGEKGKRS